MAAYWPDLDLFSFRGAFWTQPAWCPDPIIFGAGRFYESHSCVLATSNVSDHKRFADMDWFVMGWANKNHFKKSIELLLFVSWPRGGQEFFRIPFFWLLFFFCGDIFPVNQWYHFEANFWETSEFLFVGSLFLAPGATSCSHCQQGQWQDLQPREKAAAALRSVGLVCQKVDRSKIDTF